MFSWSICWVFSGSAVGKEHACQSRRPKRCGFDPWVGKIPWNRRWQPTPVSLPGKAHGQWSLAGYSPWAFKESDKTEHICTQYTVCYLGMSTTRQKFVITQCFSEEPFLSPFSYVASDKRSIKNFKTAFQINSYLWPRTCMSIWVTEFWPEILYQCDAQRIRKNSITIIFSEERQPVLSLFSPFLVFNISLCCISLSVVVTGFFFFLYFFSLVERKLVRIDCWKAHWLSN